MLGSLLVVLALLSGLLFATVTILPSKAGAVTLYDGGTGPGNYTKIQVAIDAAASGSTVYVYNGTYYEAITISKPLALIGEDKNTTMIDAGARSNVITLTASGVTIKGFKITNSGVALGVGLFSPGVTGTAGIEIDNADGNYIGDNIFTNNTDSLVLDQSDNNLIAGNIFVDNTAGIRIKSSASNTIVNNTFGENNSGGISLQFCASTVVANNTLTNGGISLDGSTNISVLDNTIADYGISVKGQSVVNWNSYTISPSNTVHGKPVYFWKNVTSGSIPQDAGQVILVNVTRVAIENLTTFHAWPGITLAFSPGNVIVNNTAMGISLYRSDRDNITNNSFSGSP